MMVRSLIVIEYGCVGVRAIGDFCCYYRSCFLESQRYCFNIDLIPFLESCSSFLVLTLLRSLRNRVNNKLFVSIPFQSLVQFQSTVMERRCQNCSSLIILANQTGRVVIYVTRWHINLANRNYLTILVCRKKRPKLIW